MIFSKKGSYARVQTADFDANGLADIFCGKNNEVKVLMNPGKLSSHLEVLKL